MESRLQVIPLHSEGRRWSIDYRIASERLELENAFRLVYELYLEWGLTRPHPAEQRVTAYHLLPTTHVLVARCESNVLATVTLVEDGRLGLPMASLYGPAIDAMRRRRERLAEVTCLAHNRSEEWLGVPVVERLMALMAQLAARQRVDRLLIAVNPQHAGFYRRIGFHVFDCVRSYPPVCGKLAVPMQLDLRSLAVDHPAAHRRFFGKDFPREQFRLKPMSPRLVQYFQRFVLGSEEVDEVDQLECRYAL